MKYIHVVARYCSLFLLYSISNQSHFHSIMLNIFNAAHRKNEQPIANVSLEILFVMFSQCNVYQYHR